jgi:hypothetical protein
MSHCGSAAQGYAHRGSSATGLCPPRLCPPKGYAHRNGINYTIIMLCFFLYLGFDFATSCLNRMVCNDPRSDMKPARKTVYIFSVYFKFGDGSFANLAFGRNTQVLCFAFLYFGFDFATSCPDRMVFNKPRSDMKPARKTVHICGVYFAIW